MGNSQRRRACLLLGWLAMAIGAVGAVLPLLPTTPFLLVALWSFSRSSPRLEQRLLSHPRFGPPLRDWQQCGAIAPSVKAVTMAGLLGSVVIVLGVTSNPLLIALHLLLVAVGAATVLSRPSVLTGRASTDRLKLPARGQPAAAGTPSPGCTERRR